MHTGADGGGAVDGHVDLDGGRNGGLEARHLGHHVVHGGDDIGAGNLEDDDQDGVLQLGVLPVGIDARNAGGEDVGDAIGNGPQVGDAPRRAGLLVISGDDGRVVAGFEDLVVVADL